MNDQAKIWPDEDQRPPQPERDESWLHGPRVPSDAEWLETESRRAEDDHRWVVACCLLDLARKRSQRP